MMLLSCCCGCHESPPAVDEWENITKVMDWAYAPNPAGIAPYARPWKEVSVGGACIMASDHPASCGVTPSPTTGDEAKVCFDTGFDRIGATIASITTGIIECSGGSGESVSGIAGNCYRKTGNQVRFDDQCKKYGWKGVQAIAQWPGRFGFVNSGSACCPDGGQDQTKYRSLEIEETYRVIVDRWERNHCDGVTPDQHIESFLEIKLKQLVVVDGSGNVNRSGYIKINSWGQTNGVRSDEVIDSCDMSLATDYVQQPLSATCGLITVGKPSPGDTFPFVSQQTNTAAALNALLLNPPPAPYDTGTERLIDNGSSPGATFTVEDALLKMEWNHDWTLEQDRNCGGSPAYDVEDHETYFYNQTIRLDDPHSYGEVDQDLDDLLDTWRLQDDAVYPWRTDGQTWLMPLVTRDAAANSPEVNWTVDEDCNFLSDNSYTGDIIGAPNPAGYGYHFNFNHTVWQAAPNPPFCSYCEKEKGELAAAPLPKSATQWTDKLEGAEVYGPGAHTSQGRKQKWAETLEAWPSINFARPCGRDRYLRDEDEVACVVSFAHPDLETDGAFEFEIGDVIGIEGNEVYQVTGKTDAENYTLGVKLYDSPVTYDDGVAKLRFPAARAICSTLLATAVQLSPGVIQITTPEKHWIRPDASAPDTLTFTGIGGLTTAVATVVTDFIFTVPGTLTTPTSGTVSHGASAEQIAFDDTCSRHDFIARSWQSQFRAAFEDPGEPTSVLTETARTLSPTSRHPSVLWCSPNSGDTFPHGYQLPFGSISADQCYDEQWHGNFLQAEPDPFWQTPHVPCGHVGGWSMVDQPCDAVDGEHYAWPPLVEPRLTLPDGAPAFSSATLHTPAGMDTKVGHSGSCTVEPNNRATYHAIRAAWLGCVDWKEVMGHRC